jgi:hypothetical protein
VIHSFRRVPPTNDGATDRTTVSSASRPWLLGVVAHSLKVGLGILFLYLGIPKLLGHEEAARLAAIGVDRYLRETIGWLELTVAALLWARASGYLFHSLVAGLALIEVSLLHRAPLAAVACLAAHGLSTWARSAHDRSGRVGPPHPTRPLRAVRACPAHPDRQGVRTRALVVHPQASAPGPRPVHPTQHDDRNAGPTPTMSNFDGSHDDARTGNHGRPDARAGGERGGVQQ